MCDCGNPDCGCCCEGRCDCEDLGPCLLWTGAIRSGTSGTGGGYGQLGKKYAHRMAYEAAHGLIPKGLQVLHKCDVRACIEPKHLYLGDHVQNAKDREARNGGYRKKGVGIHGGSKHGTRSRYTAGCRCADCTNSNTQYSRQLKIRV